MEEDSAIRANNRGERYDQNSLYTLHLDPPLNVKLGEKWNKGLMRRSDESLLWTEVSTKMNLIILYTQYTLKMSGKVTQINLI